MDHKSLYAHHIAQAIRHKKAMMDEPQEDGGELGGAEELELAPDEVEGEPPTPDAKAKRTERIRAILAR